MKRRYMNLWRDIFSYGYLSYGSTQAHSNVLVIEHERNGVDHYNPRHVPCLIGRVSLGTDYAGIVFIDHADADDPVMLWAYDQWHQRPVTLS